LPGLEAHRQKRPTRLRSPKKAPVPDHPTLRPEPDGTSKQHFHAANLGGTDRVEAEAIYDSGRERCVGVILELAGAVERLGVQCERLEDRIRRLEEQARRDSRTSSTPSSADPPKTRQQRRAEARAKAKELLAREGAKRKPGGQAGHSGRWPPAGA
jgi:uncharacterized protein DUF6444